VTGSNEDVALGLVMKAKRALIDSGVLVKDFSTAEDLLERRKKLVKCTTGSSRLDSFLKGGVETQAMTEIAGEYGSGKTQLCYTLCVTASMPLKKSGLVATSCSLTLKIRSGRKEFIKLQSIEV
jgi:DNA repair protein RadA